MPVGATSELAPVPCTPGPSSTQIPAKQQELSHVPNSVFCFSLISPGESIPVPPQALSGTKEILRLFIPRKHLCLIIHSPQPLAGNLA